MMYAVEPLAQSMPTTMRPGVLPVCRSAETEPVPVALIVSWTNFTLASVPGCDRIAGLHAGVALLGVWNAIVSRLRRVDSPAGRAEACAPWITHVIVTVELGEGVVLLTETIGTFAGGGYCADALVVRAKPM